MDKSGKSILWFLGACLIFTEGTIAAIAKVSSTISGGWILLFGFLSLMTVLTALLTMFDRNPAFILAGQGELVPLSILQAIALNNNPTLLKYLITRLPPSIWIHGETDAEEDKQENVPEPEVSDTEVDESEVTDESEQREFREALKNLDTD